MENMGYKINYLNQECMEYIEIIKNYIEILKNNKFNGDYVDSLSLTIENIENKECYSDIEAKRILISLNYMVETFDENIKKGLEAIKVKNTLGLQEIIEATIIASKNEFEEKKLKYYGFLLGNIIFRNELNEDECHRLIRLLSTLSYCKIKLINLYFISQTIQVPILKREDYTKSVIDNYELLGILQDTLEMIQKGILNGSGKLVLDVVQINPSKIRVQGIGVLLYKLLNLNKMPYDEMEDLLDILSSK